MLVRDFEATSLDGQLMVSVLSESVFTAEYGLAINCTQGIAEVAGTIFSLGAMQYEMVEFELHAYRDQDQQHNCTATLSNAIGEFLDSETVSFNVNATIPDYSNQAGSNDLMGDFVEGESYSKDECAANCNSWFDIPCFFTYGCWTDIMAFFGTIIAIVIF